MVASRNVINCLVLFIVLFDFCYGINLGLFAGDKRGSNPLTIKKKTHNSPTFINIKLSPLIPPIAPKLPKPPPLKPLKSPFAPKLPKSSSALLKKLRCPKLPKVPSLKSPFNKLRSSLLKPKIIPPLLPGLPLFPPLIPRTLLIPKLSLIPKVPFIPPLLPKLPLLPTLLPKLPLLPPPLLPLPLLPILPPPLFPIIPRLSPLKLPTLKSPLQKALGSELKPVVVPCENKSDLLEKMRKLRKDGSLTKKEFAKMKKKLIRK